MPIHVDGHAWVLETEQSAYAFGLNTRGRLVHRYWGKRLPYREDYPSAASAGGWASFNGSAHLTPEEYPAYGGTSYIDPCLKVTFADGVRDTVLRFVKAEQVSEDPSHLQIHLRDAAYPLQVILHYRVHATYNLFERWVEVRNDGTEPMLLERLWSAQWHLPQGDTYRLTHLTGRWLDEMHIRRDVLTPGIKVLESRRLTTSHHHSPWFALDRGAADEDTGDVWFGTLAWSGNWKAAIEVTDFASTRVSIGLNDWDWAWQLQSGENFVTPSSYAGYTDAGFGQASRALHDYTRERVLPHRDQTHLVLYNSWEATAFNVNEEDQGRLAEIAAEMGVELFVLDDGWFHGRAHDRAGLGDWWPDAQKFPRGLSPLIERVQSLGMRFGLWIEPEMVNPDSDLYRAHPDWVLHFPTRERTLSRDQLILNLARTDVQDYLIHHIDQLLSKHDISFIKWDMNRNVSEPGWPTARREAREVWVRYVQGLYSVWGKLRELHPDVIWQSCSGGGGRADLGILRLADQIWTSDNTEATARLSIQQGFSSLFPAKTMEAWVTDAAEDRVSLAFRFHVSMCGVLGVGGNIARWTEEQRQEAARWIALYKELRPIVQDGDLYRLRSPQEHAFSALQYMSKDGKEGVLFAFRVHIPNPVTLPALYLRGLDSQARYQIEGQTQVRSGAAWMADGLKLALDNGQSTVLRIRRQ